MRTIRKAYYVNGSSKFVFRRCDKPLLQLASTQIHNGIDESMIFNFLFQEIGIDRIMIVDDWGVKKVTLANINVEILDGIIEVTP